MNKFSIRKLILIVADVFIVFISGLITNFILGLIETADSNIHIQMYTSRLFYYVMLSSVISFLCLWFFGAYNKLWRYFKKRDYLSCIWGMLFSTVISNFIMFTLNRVPPVQFIVIYFLISTIGISLFRFTFKQTFLTLTNTGVQADSINVLIVGAGQAGRLLLTDIKNPMGENEKKETEALNVVGLVDDDFAKKDLIIKGSKVLGNTSDIPQICEAYNVKRIYFAIPSCTEEQKRKILESCTKTSCKIYVVPFLTTMIKKLGSENIIKQAKEIRVEDLLGRAPIQFDKSDIRNFISGKACLITGGGGSIGSELVRQIVAYNPRQVIIVDIYENNAYDIQQEIRLEYGNEINLVTLIASVRDVVKMEKIFKTYLPDIVFHAAAHKHVPLMEAVPEEAIKNNIFGTLNVVKMAEKYRVQKFVMISTDKAVNPTNVMGATKRCCEMIVESMAQQSKYTEFVATRFGNVLGSNGSVIPLFKRQIESGKPITVTHPDIIRYFMTIPEAVSLVLQAATIAHGGEIFVLDMGAPVKILTLAENIIKMYGKEPYKDVPIVFTGLRPGEKLYEELLMNEEGLKNTTNKKIFIGKQIKIDSDKLYSQLEELRVLAENNNSNAVVKKLAEIVPTFNHKTNT